MCFNCFQHQNKKAYSQKVCTFGKVSIMSDQYNYNISITIGSIPTERVRYFRLSSSLTFSSHQTGTVLSKDRQIPANTLFSHLALHTFLLLPCSAVLWSCDSSALRAAVTETQVLLTTDAITDHGREGTVQPGVVALFYMKVY